VGGPGATIGVMGSKNTSQKRLAYCEAILEVSNDPTSVKKYVEELGGEREPGVGKPFPVGVGAELYRDAEGRYVKWVAIRSSDLEPVEEALLRGTLSEIRGAAGNPMARTDWVDACLQRGPDEAGACILGLSDESALDAIERCPVVLPVLAFEKLVRVAFAGGPQRLGRLRSLRLVANFEIYIHNILPEAEARFDSLRWYAARANRDLLRCRREVRVSDPGTWAALLREMSIREQRETIKNILPGGVVDYLRMQPQTQMELGGGLSDRALRSLGSWRNSTWRGPQRRRLTRRAVERILAAERHPSGIVGMLQRYFVTEESLGEHLELRDRLERGGWIRSGSLGVLGRQRALVPYLVREVRDGELGLKHYDISSFWGAVWTHPSDLRQQVARELGSLLRHAPARNVDETMFEAAGTGEWKRDWLDMALCGAVGGKGGSWVLGRLGEAAVAHFADWSLPARVQLLQQVKGAVGDSVEGWETAGALLTTWTLEAAKLTAALGKLGRTS